jgi:hypothetical protein
LDAANCNVGDGASCELDAAKHGNLLVSTIGTANTPIGTGKLEVKNQSLIKLENETAEIWSLYFGSKNVELTEASEGIRSVSVGDALENNIFLTLSGDFAVESVNEDEGDKNDIEGCRPFSL